MKLHLPCGLRRAVLSCLAALASLLPATVASASGIAAIGAFAFVAHAQDVSDEEDEDEWLTAPIALPAPEGGYTEQEISGTSISDLSGNVLLTKNDQIGNGSTLTLASAAQEATGTNVKITARVNDQAFINVQNLWADTLWLAAEGGNGRFKIGNSDTMSHIGTLYIGGASQLWNTAQVTLQTNLNIGTTTYSENNEFTAAALRVSANLTLQGNLTIESDAKITFQAKTMTINGALLGNSNLTLDYYNSGSGELVITGTGSVFTGKVIMNRANQWFKLGQNVSIGGLNGDGHVLRYDNSASSQDTTLTITGQGGVYNGELGYSAAHDRIGLTIASGASQTINGTKKFDLTDLAVNGTLILTGNNTTRAVNGTLSGEGVLSIGEGSLTVSGGVTVAAGKTLTLDGVWNEDGTTMTAGAVTLNGTISNAGTVAVRGYATSRSAVTLALSAEQLVKITGGTLALDILLSETATDNNLTLNGLFGGNRAFGDQAPDLKLIRGLYEWNTDYNGGHSVITVQDGAQMFFDGGTTVDLFIEGMGYTANHKAKATSQFGAIRVNSDSSKVLRGTITLLGDAAIDGAGTIASTITGGSHTLFKHGNGSITLSGAITGLSGLITRNLNQVDSVYTNAGDGGYITVTGSLQVSNGFVFGIMGSRQSGPLTITLGEGSALYGSGTISKIGQGTLVLSGGLYNGLAEDGSGEGEFTGSWELEKGAIKLSAAGEHSLGASLTTRTARYNDAGLLIQDNTTPAATTSTLDVAQGTWSVDMVTVAADTTLNVTASAGALKVGTLTGAGTLAIAGDNVEAESVVVAVGNTLTITGKLTVSDAVSVRGTLDIAGATLAAPEEDSDVGIYVSMARGAKLNLGSDLAGLKFFLEDDIEGNTYTLEADGGSLGGLTADMFDTRRLARGRDVVSVEGGVITLSEASDPGDITYAGDSFTWMYGCEGWTNDDSNESDFFRKGDNVTLSGSSATATLGEDIVAGTVTVSSGKWTLSMNDYSLTASGMTIGSTGSDAEEAPEIAASLKISGNGNKQFGNITIHKDGMLEVTSGAGWSGNRASFVSGEGTLKLNLGGVVNNSNIFLPLFRALLSTEASSIINKVVIADGTSFDIGTRGDTSFDLQTRLNHIRNLWVEDGAGFTINADIANTSNVTLHLSGEGVDGMTTKAALTVYDHSNYGANTTVNVLWNMVLEDSATVSVASVAGTIGANTTASVANFKGKFTAKGNTLTKIGTGTMSLASGFTVNAEDRGKLSVEEGKLQFAFATAASDMLKNFDVELTDNGILDLTAQSYTIHSLQGSGGSVTGADGATLVIDYDTDELLPAGVSSAAAITGVALTKKGSGTQTLTGAIGSSSAGIGTISVQGGKLVLGTIDAQGVHSGGVVYSSGMVVGTAATGTDPAVTADVIINTIGAKKFGTITVNEGSTVTVTTSTGWSKDNVSIVSGKGTLIVEGLDFVDDAVKGTTEDFFKALLPTDVNNKLGHLKFSNSVWGIGWGGPASMQTRIQAIEEMEVASGSSLAFVNNDGNAAQFFNTRTHLLRIAGAGYDGRGAIYTDYSGTNYFTIQWKLQLDADATVKVAHGPNRAGGELTLSGEYNGGVANKSYTLTKLGGSTLTLGGLFSTKENSCGAFKVQEGTLKLSFTENTDTALAAYDVEMAGGTLTLGAGNEYAIHKMTGSGTVTATENGATLTLAYDDTQKVAESAANITETTVTSGSNTSTRRLSLKKTKAGTQRLTGSVSVDGISVSGGELELTGATDASGAVSITGGSLRLTNQDTTLGGGVTVSGSGSVLKLAMKGGWGSDTSAAALTLENGGKLQLDMAKSGSETTAGKIQLATLTTSGSEAAQLEWSAAELTQELHIAELTGSAELALAEMSGTDKETNGRYLHLGTIKNFTGSVTGAARTQDEANRVYINTIDVDAGHSGGSIRLAEGAVYATSLKKLGEGAFTIGNELVVLEELHMNYDGTLTLEKGLTLSDGLTLHYSSQAGAQVFDLSAGLFDAGLTGIQLNVNEVDDTLLQYEGLKLGISWSEQLGMSKEDYLTKFAELMRLDGATANLSFEWRGDELYLTLSNLLIADMLWDTAWGSGTLKGAPDSADMEGHILDKEGVRAAFNEETAEGEFNAHALQLQGSDYHTSESGGLNYIRLTSGSTHAKATVVGGSIYTPGEEADTRVRADSFISFIPEEEAAQHLHLLVGGSSCLVSSVNPGADGVYGGFWGDSHIQMDGGSVDYIVGGNHVNNTSFTFVGDSYISIFSGNVEGGIVGGSTLTRGSNDASVYAFQGNSHIHIYTLLQNPTTELPSISDATESAGGEALTGAAFGAVVGGNAWVDLGEDSAADTMNPTFYGNSYVVIDLVHEQTKGDQTITPTDAAGEFQKNIVGGNYTAMQGEGAEERSTAMLGNSSITICADTEKHIFTGDINGASRRATSGSGTTVFTGRTSICIDGGAYRGTIAGGFWFEDTAAGNHTAVLTGNTSVTLQGGEFWRVLGGSHSLGGGAEAEESILGVTQVTINGGKFSSTGSEQTQIGFVAGGSFFRDNAGSHTHSANPAAGLTEFLTSVIINDGEFKNMHIVGGDYANFCTAGDGTPSASIEGATSVAIAGGSITGMVVGGSYMTDEGAGGSVSVTEGAQVSITGGSIAADTAPDYSGVAVVGGSVIIDLGEETGKHSATMGGETEVSITGGRVSGHVVGGSYAYAADGGSNTLRSGEVSLTLSGGEVQGSVYGGHYSAGLQADELHAGDISITLDGAAVSGDIVGGNYVTASQGDAAGDSEGISISLSSGTLGGSVYAAGWHAAAQAGSLQETVKSTEVSISSGFAFTAGAHTVSGGFYKADAVHDASTVEQSTLIFGSEGGYSREGALKEVSFADFDVVEVANADTTVWMREMLSSADSFTKAGEGDLVITDLVGSSGAPYTGRIVVAGGTLRVEKEQSVAGGLVFDITGRIAGNSSAAYLQGAGGLTLGNAAEATVTITASDNVKIGSYFLASGLDEELTAENFSQLLEGDVFTANDELGDTAKLKFELVVNDGNLILRVRHMKVQGFVWEGDQYGDAVENKVWQDDSYANWQESDVTANEETPDGKSVVFDESSGGDVLIEGAVHPSEVAVRGGSYVFKQHGNTENDGEYGLADEDLLLTVGGGNTEAQLELQLASSGVKSAVLKEKGTLILADAEAISDTTELYFNGGTLAYKEAEQGDALYGRDLSRQVSADSNEKVRIQVGEKGALDENGTPTDEINRELNVTWEAQDASNNGVKLALTEGVVKSGLGSFTLSWDAAAADMATVAGDIRAEEGTLVFAAAGTAEIGGDAEAVVEVEQGAEVVFVADKEGDAVNINRSFREASLNRGAAGSVIIGSAGDSGSYALNSVNDTFTGAIELRGSGGSAVSVASAEALGGEDTTLRLNGRNIVFTSGDSKQVEAGVVEVVKDAVNYVGGMACDAANSAIEFTGDLQGEGVLANAAGAFHHTLSGDLSEFTGTIVANAAAAVAPLAAVAPRAAAPELSTWTLHSDSATPGTIRAALAGNGVIIIDYAAGAVLTGQIGDAIYGSATTLRNVAEGEVVIRSVNTSESAVLDFGDGHTFRLGDAEDSGAWRGSDFAGSGSFILTNGTLYTRLASRVDGVTISVETAEDAGTEVNAGGNDGSIFSSINIRKGGHLSSVSGTINVGAPADAADVATTPVYMVLDLSNVGGVATGDSVICNSKTLTLAVNDASDFHLNFTGEALVDILKRHMVDGFTWLYLTDGTLQISKDTADQLLLTPANKLLAALGFNFVGADGGAMQLAGTSQDVYLVLDASDPATKAHELDDCTELGKYKATVVDRGETLRVHLSGAVDNHANVVDNLLGLEDAHLYVDRQAGVTGAVDFVLNNAVQNPSAQDGSHMPDGSSTDDVAVDTSFAGTIHGDKGVNFHKTGDGTLTVGANGRGGLELKGNMSLEAGALVLGGVSSMQDFTFDYADDAVTGGLTILAGETTIRGSIHEDASGEGNSILLQKGGSLTLLGTSTLSSATIGGDMTGAVTLGDAEGASSAALSLAGSALLSDVALLVNKKSSLDVGATQQNRLTTLSGEGTLAANGGSLELTSKGSAFSGSLKGNGALTVARGASLVFDNIASADSAWNITNAGDLTIDLTNGRKTSFGSLALAAGSLTTLEINTGLSRQGGLMLGDFDWAQGAQLVLHSDSVGGLQEGSLWLGHVDSPVKSLDSLNVKLRGKSFLHYTGKLVVEQNGDLLLALEEQTQNAFIFPMMSKNAAAGAALMWEATDTRSAVWSYLRRNPDGDLARVTDAVVDMLQNGRSARLESTLAAVGGSSVSTLGSALSQDIRRQLNSLRNRAAQSESSGSGELNTQLWISGESAYHKMDADGFAPGYTLNNWGGSVGMLMEVDPDTAVGLSITAMYGDLKTSAIDHGKGDLDTTYFSAFARVHSGVWMHSFIATAGKVDASMSRTVNYGSGSYHTKGQTDGYTFGFMYEAGYSIALNKEATMALQPVLNIQYRYGALSGYTETGSDAGLRVDDIDQSVFTIGLGARFQSVVGQTALNRDAFLEARLLVTGDLGDRSGTARNALLSGGKVRAEVESASIGTMGVEIGAGLTLPVSQQTSFFIDASAELRSGYTNLNAGAGIKVSF